MQNNFFNSQNNVLRKQFIQADNEALLDTKTVAAYMGLSLQWFSKKAARGDGIPYRKIGIKRMYKKADVLAWIDKNCQNGQLSSDSRHRMVSFSIDKFEELTYLRDWLTEWINQCSSCNVNSPK